MNMPTWNGGKDNSQVAYRSEMLRRGPQLVEITLKVQLRTCFGRKEEILAMQHAESVVLQIFTCRSLQEEF